MNERFFMLRKRLFGLIERQLKRDNCCKPYEGSLEVHIEYDDYFEDYREEPYAVFIYLHCYCVGPDRHYKFEGETMETALDGLEQWIYDREKEEEEFKSEDQT